MVKTDKSSKRAKPKAGIGPTVAKISRPRIGGVVQRKRLFRLLDDCRKYPITYICGPAGSGKTTLVGSYLDFRKLSALWYQVDEGDADIATFFYYLGVAARRSARRRRPLPMLTPEYLLDIPTFTLRYFENLFSRLTPPFFLVFDNYQRVPPESKFHEIVRDGLSILPEGIQVIIISRQSAPSVFSRLYANGQTKVLGWEELRLTLKESGEIIRLRAKGKQAKGVIEPLHKMADGWVAGLVLLWESRLREGTEVQVRERLTSREIIDYFGSELFEKLDGRIRDFLVRTAFLPRMTGEIAEKLTANKLSKEILSQLNRDQFFTERKLHFQPTFQYHPLFREFLLFKANSSFAPDEIKSLRQRSAQLLEESGELEEAANLFIEAGDWEGTGQIILRNAQTLIGQGRNQTLEGWLNRIPKEILNNNPWLFYWFANCIQPFKPAESLSLFERAFELFQGRKEIPGTLLAWVGAVDAIQAEWDDFSRLDRWIEWLTVNFGREALPVSPEIEALIASSMVGALTYRRIEHPDIKWWIDRALLLCNKIGRPDLRLRAYANASLYYQVLFDPIHFNLMAEEIKKITGPQKVSPLFLIHWKYTEAVMHSVFSTSLEKSLQSISEGLQIARETGVHILDPALFFAGVATTFATGDRQLTQRFLKNLEGVVGDNQRSSLVAYYFSMAWHYFLIGNASQALLHGELALKLAEQVTSSLHLMFIHNLLALVHDANGEFEKAKTHLNLAKEIVRHTGSLYFEFLFLLTEAHFALERQKKDEGLKLLQKAFAVGRKWGITDTSMPHFWQPTVLVRLCKEALEAGIEVEYVRKLIRDSHLIPESPPVEIDNWPWPLRIYTLGRFELERDGEPVRFSGKVQHKPLLLLKALIALGGQEVPEEQIADSLWPKSEGDLAHSAFTSTLSRLRRLLGRDDFIRFQEGKAILDPRVCWVDAWSFEKLLEKAAAVWKSPRFQEKKINMALMAKASVLYKGHFLPHDEEHSWTFSMRERLRSKFHGLMERLGGQLQQNGAWEEAAEHYQKALEIDNLEEEFYRQLMVCYLRLGRHAEAVQAYYRCKKTLATILGVDPSPKTEALYRTLKGEGRTNH